MRGGRGSTCRATKEKRLRELLKRGEPPKAVFRRGLACKKERCNAKRRGWRRGLRSYVFKHSISKIRFNACGANQPTKLDHEVTDIISLSPADGRAAQRKKFTEVYLSVSHPCGHRNEQDNGDEAQQKWECVTFAPGVFVNIA